jgi:perosamine synthetase
MTQRVPLSRPTTGEEELAAVQAVLASSWLAGQGPEGGKLERGFAELTGREHAVAVNNCTAGLHLALIALGVGPGDEVLVADYSYPATGHAVLHTGATPRFVDVDRTTGCLDPSLISAKVTDRTKAVIGVDSLGLPADWPAIETVAREHGLAVLADAACSAGGTLEGRPAGSFGDLAVFSLHARKGITCGEGGMVVTDNAAIADVVRSWACFGVPSALSRVTGARFSSPEFLFPGYNYKLSDILAAIANVQLTKLSSFVHERRRLASRYSELLQELEFFAAPQEPIGRKSAWQTYALTVARAIDRDRLIDLMRAEGLECTIGTFSMSRQPVYGSTDQCPRSWDLANRQLAIPLFVGMDDESQVRVVDALTRLAPQARR